VTGTKNAPRRERLMFDHRKRNLFIAGVDIGIKVTRQLQCRNRQPNCPTKAADVQQARQDLTVPRIGHSSVCRLSGQIARFKAGTRLTRRCDRESPGIGNLTCLSETMRRGTRALTGSGFPLAEPNDECSKKEMELLLKPKR